MNTKLVKTLAFTSIMLNGSVKLHVLVVFKLFINFCLGVQFHKLIDDPIISRQGPLKDSQVTNGTIYENGIPHVEINEFNLDIDKIKTLEDALKNILAMEGVKYIFERSFYWRTWREVQDIEGISKLVCYRCENAFNATCRSCICGHWEIEENPPCPFEIFSVINDTNMCVAYYNQLKYSNYKCASIISFEDIRNCDNPLRTRWRISRRHDTDISERHVNVICKERENCNFSTVYSIFPDRVSFKVINSSNNIIYSRVMKNDNKNYACLNDCSEFKTNAKLQEKALQFRNNTGRDFDQNLNEATKKILGKKNSNTIKPSRLHVSSTKDATTTSVGCKHLQNTHSEEEYDESEYIDY